MPLSRSGLQDLARLLDALPGPLYLVNPQGRILYANAACAAWTGLELAALVGQTCRYHALPQPPQSPADWAALLAPPPDAFTGGVRTFEITWRGVDDWVHVRRATCLALCDATTQEADDSAALLVLVASQDSPANASSVDPHADPHAHQLHALLARLLANYGPRELPEALIGQSPRLERLRAQLQLAATARTPVLVVGPEGSQRLEVARFVALQSTANPVPPVPFACALADLELWQAFLDAIPISARATPADIAPLANTPADTVLLEDVDFATPELQPRLATWLAETPLRVLATARSPLIPLANQGEFHPDLAERLSVLVLELAPLAQRREDLPLLIQRIVEQQNARGPRQLAGVSPDALDRLLAADWPGDLAELFDIVRSAHAQADGPLILLRDLPRTWLQARDAADAPSRSEPSQELAAALADYERTLIQQALDRARGNKTLAARRLGLTRPKLYRRMLQLGLVEPPSAPPTA